MKAAMSCLLLLAIPAAAIAAESAPASSAQAQSPATTTFLVLYRPGPAWVAGKPVKEQPPRTHGRYMLDLFKQGKLKEAGSFPDDSGAAIVLTVADAAEAKALIEADPAVSGGVFRYRIHPWAPVPWRQYVK